MSDECSFDLPVHQIPEGLMIGPRSFRTDRILPALERLHLAATQTEPGRLTLKRGLFDFEAPHKPRFRQRLKARFHENTNQVPKGRLVMDFRPYSPKNWAHFLNDHLALLALALDLFELDLAQIHALLPRDAAGYIQNLCRLLGIDFTCTDATIRAEGIQVLQDSYIPLRGGRVTWMQNRASSPVMGYYRAQGLETATGDRRVYLARKRTRNVVNDDAVAAFLAPYGFTRIFMEELSVAEQLTLLLESEVIVAVHGAALAPLAYKFNATRATKVIEIFPVGHVTNNFRCIADQIGAEWIGVLGRTAPFNLPYLYDLPGPYTRHSLSSFEVDTESLRAALEIMGLPHPMEKTHEN